MEQLMNNVIILSNGVWRRWGYVSATETLEIWGGMNFKYSTRTTSAGENREKKKNKEDGSCWSWLETCFQDITFHLRSRYDRELVSYSSGNSGTSEISFSSVLPPPVLGPVDCLVSIGRAGTCHSMQKFNLVELWPLHSTRSSSSELRTCLQSREKPLHVVKRRHLAIILSCGSIQSIHSFCYGFTSSGLTKLEPTSKSNNFLPLLSNFSNPKQPHAQCCCATYPPH